MIDNWAGSERKLRTLTSKLCLQRNDNYYTFDHHHQLSTVAAVAAAYIIHKNKSSQIK